ncbi:zinc dependent phospholipase C family protein [Serpentinicella alkaliphila]|uniref:Zinc dependent phospholipase C n=1 Tax=Serpentinicella alkaliphila TaxID=1734049 RepID=A0A4R2U243_9FIRM|nr:zinc dependent phospholipase C family protein [Serpentinicella alkaliphila]QUH26241.1 zinc dependent phospholipase C family protein [Serpentinicella alkaliphila]TCQ01703.1 zinc dependent phospholipase C [Serpentinicella alkaliphila]
MLTLNHLDLAKFILRISTHSNLRRYRVLFTLGCIWPDINLLTYIVGHNSNKRLTDVEKHMEKLMKLKYLSPVNAFRFGVALHYVADCFTMAHNPLIFKGNIMEHLDYEKKLFSQIRKRFNMSVENLSQLKQEEEFVSITQMHKNYLKNDMSCSNDANYIIYACIRITDILNSQWARKKLSYCSNAFRRGLYLQN